MYPSEAIQLHLCPQNLLKQMFTDCSVAKQNHVSSQFICASSNSQGQQSIHLIQIIFHSIVNWHYSSLFSCLAGQHLVIIIFFFISFSNHHLVSIICHLISPVKLDSYVCRKTIQYLSNFIHNSQKTSLFLLS